MRRRDLKAVQAILGILDEVEKIAQETPPVDNAASRFGNPAFKTFYDKVEAVSTRRCLCEACSS